jgi:hypothetical protein
MMIDEPPVATVYTPPVAAVYTPDADVVEVAPQEAVKECPFCGEEVRAAAKKCKHCGETIDVALRATEELKRRVERAEERPNAPMVFMNAGGASSSASSSSAAAVVSARGYRRRPVYRFPHLMHLILTFFTCGVWLPIWIAHYAIYIMAPHNGALVVGIVGIPLAVCIFFGGLILLVAVSASRMPAHTAQIVTTAPAKDGNPTKTGEAGVAEEEPNRKADEQKANQDAKRQAAKEKADREKADQEKAAKQKAAEEKAAANLRFARKLLINNEIDRAKQRLREIIQEFPGTESAKEAKQLLELQDQ